MSIDLSNENLKLLIHNRKKTFEEVTKGLKKDEKFTYVNSIDDVKSLAGSLNVKVSQLFNDSNENDLNDGVKIQYNNEGYRRISQRNGKEYYTYQHLVTTNTEPNLMPLRVSLHCKEDENLSLNEGHDSKEMIYVTKGKIKMDWKSEGEKLLSQELNIGDSVYINPGVPHSFMALEEESELIAFNY